MELFIGSVDMLALQQAASIALLRKPLLRFSSIYLSFNFLIYYISFFAMIYRYAGEPAY